ncbi:hypothetical protein CAPTEDRAFT_4204 [Capitella teleta]|uniref:Phosphorylase b kinase regulatory subunit n=1 Tax=Capitella teleta TaxID=283909 RepID=R7TTD0_CAPTE|nr:hypothetical protein CAPTEDRAFT_4204 [Capitella teleta]|eukprot:ELT96852.1 hypothetical protein CAPTEDRAFT_4204 [Capitella teleta]
MKKRSRSSALTISKWVKRQILRYQSPTTGLFPCDLSHPSPSEAHVRDSLYCAACVWALSSAYKRIDDDKGRTHELSQSAVKCMRGILACWMRQADKVEKFKQSQSTKNALHSKFYLVTGDPVHKDDEYEHLQIDCVALYLIFLVQMIQSGLQIIFTTDEVNFVQNLVFYVERAYRTPDYGMWERGSSYNNGVTEMHASSIGMAKAALEAVNGSNMFGGSGTNYSVVFIDIDAHYRNRMTFDTMLPRESASKNTDASLISAVSWPAFGIHEEALMNRTLEKVQRKLRGRYGFKRFLRDGAYTEAEDKNRKYYRQGETNTFDGIECEWPLFCCYFIIDSVYKGDQEKVEYWQNELKPLLKPSVDGDVLPRYYYVAKEDLEAEKAHPGSQERHPSSEGENNNFFLWGQSVYIISQLLVDNLLTKHELDPVRRYLPASKRPKGSKRYSAFQSSPTDLVIQVTLIAESVRLQQMLATYGIQTQTPHQIEPIQIWPPSELVKAYEQLGVNEKLGLKGRPPRPIGGLGTAKIYRACGETFLCYPLLFEVSDFYLSQDMQFVIDDIKSDLKFLGKCWKLAGRPTFCMLIREDNLRGHSARYIFDLLAQFKRGDCDGIKIRLGRLQEFISSACIEHLDFLSLDFTDDTAFHPFMEKDMGKQFRSLTDIPQMARVEESASTDLWDDPQECENSYAQVQMLQVLLNREGLYFRVHNVTVEEKLEKISLRAGTRRQWAVVRYAASLLGKVVDSLAPSITAILVRGKQVTLGAFGHEEEVIDKPISPDDIRNILYTRCYPFDVVQAVLQQELVLSIGRVITTNPELFNGILKIRIGWIVQAMQLELNYRSELHPGADSPTLKEVAYLSPTEIKRLLLHVLTPMTEQHDDRSVIWNRQLSGALNRVPQNFYDRMWTVLERTPAGLKVSGYHLPQQPTLSDMTEYELNFSLLVELMLSKIADPAYRQIIVEAFMVVATLLDRNPELSFSKPVDMDKIVNEAFEMFQKDRSQREEEEKQDSMNSFYNSPANLKHGTTSYIARAALNLLLEGEINRTQDLSCVLS